MAVGGGKGPERLAYPKLGASSEDVLSVDAESSLLPQALTTSAAAASPTSARRTIGRRGESSEVTPPVCRLRALDGRQPDTVKRR